MNKHKFKPDYIIISSTRRFTIIIGSINIELRYGSAQHLTALNCNGNSLLSKNRGIFRDEVRKLALIGDFVRD